MKILVLDIETAPHLAYCWGLFKQNISISQVMNSGYVLCWSAKWYGSKEKTQFASVQHGTPKRMLQGIHALLDKADVVLTYNGNSFDLPTLQKEFVLYGLKPPDPYKSIDLCKVVQSSFRFASSKLNFVCQALGLGSKIRHVGFELWVKCMANDARSWRDMERYNRNDVVILERLYDRLKPWIKSHPNVSTHDDVDGCPTCGSNRINRRGIFFTTTMQYPKYSCRACGKWFRGAYSLKAERKERFRGV